MNNNDLKEKLETYIELKEFIEEYNKEQLKKGLDLANRIISDLLGKYPSEIGLYRVRWGDDYYREELVLEIRVPFENNGYFLSNNKDAKNYILERYPDAKKHYLGIQVAECISKRNIDDFIEKLNDE